MSNAEKADKTSHIIETKKRKLLEEYDDCAKKKANLEHIENSTTYPVLTPIIADEYGKSVETEKMFVGKVNSKKETSRLIKELSACFPLNGKSHLKRVRWTKDKDIFEILIRPLLTNDTVGPENSASLECVMKDSKVNTTGLMDTVILRDIPKDPALTYKQFKEASEFWPMQFREDKHIEKLLKDEIFDHKEKASIQTFMKMCISAAKYGDEKVGCVVVDPLTSQVIAISHDRRQHHPLQHAVMVAAELVAKSQGGGSWDIESEHTYHLPYSQEDVNKKIGAMSELYPGKDVKKMCLPYLCTGYDLYVSREPCVMCAMALVHSRIRRVFYATSTSWGALGSHWKLHLQQGLNHHYEVWKVTLEECDIHEKSL